MIKNPILSGFYPDPSICRVGDDFYMVTSSFSFYPGVPIFHSKDLVNWEQIGHVLERPSQLKVDHLFMSAGIFAPTIRYNNGTFYMLTTNMSMGVKSFICTAEDPKGPWSEPFFIEGVGGIDPSLFFDDDGRVYYTSTCPRGFGGNEERPIWCSEIDLEKMQLVGEPWDLWAGALKNADSPEGPHIYKKDGWYYLLIAEGGTQHYHAVTIARSKDIHGPFVGYEGNPILTHRHLGSGYPFTNMGHADMVELKDGSWYMVMLGSRLIDGKHKVLGRETFLAPVIWENGWPVVSPCTGKVEAEYDSPGLPEYRFKNPGKIDDFDGDSLSRQWNYIGTPNSRNIKVADSKLYLKLSKLSLVPWEIHGKKINFTNKNEFLESDESISFVGKRVTGIDFDALTEIEFKPEGKESAGLAVIQNNNAQFRLEYILDESGKGEIVAVKMNPKVTGNPFMGETREFVEEKLGSMKIDSEKVCLKISARGVSYSFYAGPVENNLSLICSDVNGGFLGSESCDGFIGAYVGMFATGNGVAAEKYAEFEWFEYN